MKKLSQFLALTGIMACAFIAQARDDKLILSIHDALNNPEAAKVLDPQIKVYYAQGSGKVIKANLVTNRKTNGVGKTDEAACQWAFLSAVKQLQQQAVAEHATKVVNVVSYYKKNTMASTSQYECHAGGVVVGVALKGDLAR